MANILIMLVCIIFTALAEYKQAPYANWAHSHWVWQNVFEQSQSSIENMVKEYTRRGIPVGAVNIDAGWATAYNNFIWNTTKFPTPKAMINNFHQQNIRVILWVGSILNQ
jgi:alpha-glucosidase (family GH31 glycosyl hydrolase)